MNNANYVDNEIKKLLTSGIPYDEAAWKAALLCVGWPYIFGDRGQYCTPGQRRTVYNKHTDQTGLVKQCQVLSDKSSVCNGCKWYPSGLRVRSFDCRGFTYWILKQIYGWELMGAGATSQWNNADNWKSKGEIDTIPENMLVCLFVYKGGKMQHTGFGYKGETCECANGVQHFTTRNKKWTHWGLPKCVDGEAPAPDPDKMPILKKGSQGSYVTLAQTKLIQLGYDVGKTGADGKFGNNTEKAVIQFQKDQGLEPNGAINQATWDALDDPKPAGNLYTVSIPHLPKFKAEALVQQYTGASMVEERW